MSDETAPGKSPETIPEKKTRGAIAEEHWLLDWVATLGTVFLSGAALSSCMRWFAAGHPWDLGGAIFSGLTAWISYRFTLSDNALSNVTYRQLLAFTLPLIWCLFFPVLMMGMGLK